MTVMEISELPTAQFELACWVNSQSGMVSRLEWLRRADARSEDKAAVAEFWFGPGTGREFLP